MRPSIWRVSSTEEIFLARMASRAGMSVSKAGEGGMDMRQWTFRWPLSGGVFIAPDDFGDFKKAAIGFRGVLQYLFDRQGRLDDIFAQHVVERQGVGHWLNVFHIQLADFVHIGEDRF